MIIGKYGLNFVRIDQQATLVKMVRQLRKFEMVNQASKSKVRIETTKKIN